MVEVGRVIRREGRPCAAVEAYGELDCRVSASAKIGRHSGAQSAKRNGVGKEET